MGSQIDDKRPPRRIQNPAYRSAVYFCIGMIPKKDKNNTTAKKEYKPSRITKLKIKFADLIEFLTYGIWRIDYKSLSKKTSVFYNIIKTVILTVRNTLDLELGSKAASLTYRTVLSIVPFLAVLFAIARGFGFENIIQSEILSYMGMTPAGNVPEEQSNLTIEIITLINNSLEYAKGSGVFAGVGVILLLYTVFTLFRDIENNFNRIWQIKKGRSMQRRALDYFALILFLPIMIILNYGLSIVLSSFTKYIYILYPVTQFLNILPYIITVVIFTLLYKFMPNTKVKLFNAFIAALVAGAAYQVFQMLYLNGQIWITKYNAIYGTFAAIPLLLLWLQLSWYIVLIGAALSFAAQNVRKFSFEKETKNISRRYRDFFTLIIASTIVKRFAEGKPPLNNDEISNTCEIPVGLTNEVLDDLQAMRIISPTFTSKKESVTAYQPALDINMITVNFLMTRIDQFGSEDFNIDTKIKFGNHWKAFMESRMCFYQNNKDKLLKDL